MSNVRMISELLFGFALHSYDNEWNTVSISENSFAFVSVLTHASSLQMQGSKHLWPI